MTVADQIKAATTPSSMRRCVMATLHCVRRTTIDYGLVWYSEFTFIDGSTLKHRGYW